MPMMHYRQAQVLEQIPLLKTCVICSCNGSSNSTAVLVIVFQVP